jgi:hypothetical protein
MASFTTVTDEVLERARRDPAYRRKLLSDNLEVLLATLNKMRTAKQLQDKDAARQIRDGVDLAVRLADILQSADEGDPSKAA